MKWSGARTGAVKSTAGLDRHTSQKGTFASFFQRRPMRCKRLLASSPRPPSRPIACPLSSFRLASLLSRSRHIFSVISLYPPPISTASFFFITTGKLINDANKQNKAPAEEDEDGGGKIRGVDPRVKTRLAEKRCAAVNFYQTSYLEPPDAKRIICLA